jgi:hypothetical protein
MGLKDARHISRAWIHPQIQILDAGGKVIRFLQNPP